MSNPSENKLQELIQKFGGFAGIALITLTCFMYQSDRSSMNGAIAGLEKNIAANQRAISRLQEGKVSREEFKNVQEQWIRETQGLRQDLRDLASVLRVDLKGAKQ